MFIKYLIILVIVINECKSIMKCPNVRSSLGFVRKRRHLVFPHNSNVVLTASLVKAFMTHAPAGWNIALELDVQFPLPDEKFTLAHGRRKLHHRQKKELWKSLQSAIEFHNLNGEACILKSICEAKLYLGPPGKSLVHDELRAIFTAPVMEQDFVEEMQGSYDKLLEPDFCDNLSGCPLSLLHFISPMKRT